MRILRYTGVYKLYEKWLEKQTESKEKPRHVCIIIGEESIKMDERLSKVIELIRWCKDLGIKVLTICIPEAKARNSRTMEVIRRRIEDINGIKFEEREKTLGGEELIVNFIVGYGGREDIIKATKTLAKKVLSGQIDPEEVDEKEFQRYLLTSCLPISDIDLIIRISGGRTLSNFLIWQSAYSEFVFMDIRWEELRKIDFMRKDRYNGGGNDSHSGCWRIFRR